MTSYDQADLSRLGEFDSIIDVRSPSEFEEDHIPGAINCPVLDDVERARVGTLYKQSPFEARKIGTVLVARNIARHVEANWLGQPKSWRPLVYCWRGGQRSGAMTHILRQIGFAAERLAGGYKSYRRHVLEQLQVVPSAYAFRVVCGLTGSGKSRLLAALKQSGAQVLDLEQIAHHRGSVLGSEPGTPQPRQKGFDSQLLASLCAFIPEKPVYVESESRKIGSLSLPDALLQSMRDGMCIRLEAPLNLRVALLCEDYAHFLHDPELLVQNLERLRGMYPNEVLDRWCERCRAQDWAGLVPELLERHYDPAYEKSIRCNYPAYDASPGLMLNSLSEQDFYRLADEALALPEDFDNNGAHPMEPD